MKDRMLTLHKDTPNMPPSFWEGFAKGIAENEKMFEAVRKSTTPTHEDMHRRFDI